MAQERELFEPNEGAKRYLRRDENGQFTASQDDVGRSALKTAREMCP